MITRQTYRFAVIVLLLGVAAFLTGCSQQESPSATPTTTAAAPDTAKAADPNAAKGGFKVALLTPSPISDKGWGASANEGIEKIKTDLSAIAAPPVESPAPAEVAGILRNFAQDGATIVFAHGSEYDTAAKTVSADFPNTTFVVMGGRSTGKNLAPIQFAGGQATYLAGMLAAGMSKSGKIGLVGPNKIPIIADAFTAFEHGAHSLKPGTIIKITYTGDDKDTAKGKQAAQSLMDSGCDVIMHNANNAGNGVFQAVGEKPGVYVIGANADQSDQATAQNLGSFILDVPNAMDGVAKKIKAGGMDGKAYNAGLADKAVGFKYNPGFKGTIPADLKAKIAKAEQAMAAGTLDPMK